MYLLFHPSLNLINFSPFPQIKPNHTLLLPLWLAELLAVQRLGNSSTQPLLTLDLPAALAPRVLHALRADAKSVDLRLLAQGGFYGLVGRVGELFEVEDVADVVGEVSIPRPPRQEGGRDEIGFRTCGERMISPKQKANLE